MPEAVEGDLGWPEWRPTHRHYKGGLYRVLTFATTESDHVASVVYDDERGHIWVRPTSEFTDKFTRLKDDFDAHLSVLEAALSRAEAEREGEHLRGLRTAISMAAESRQHELDGPTGPWTEEDIAAARAMLAAETDPLKARVIRAFCRRLASKADLEWATQQAERLSRAVLATRI